LRDTVIIIQLVANLTNNIPISQKLVIFFFEKGEPMYPSIPFARLQAFSYFCSR